MVLLIICFYLHEITDDLLILLKLEIEMQNLNIIQRNHSLCIQDADLGFDQMSN